MTWTAEPMPSLKGFTVEWAEPGNFYLSRRNRIFHTTDLNGSLKEIARVDAPGWKTAASGLRLTQRLLRFMVYNVVPLPNGDIFVTFDKSVGVIRDGKYRGLPGLVRSCRVLRSGCAVDPAGDLYFGEYLANDERGEMLVYRFPAGGLELEVAHTFPAGSIKHIHGLYLDEFTNSIYCLTGDADPECQFIRTSDGFRTIETVGGGDESWRAVSMLFDENNMYYGTDAEYRDNEVIAMDRSSLERSNIGTVNGTVFYSKRIGKDLFFTTTAENAPSQVENVAAIWHVDSAGILSRLASFPKDHWHGGLFMFGTIHFPFQNAFDDRLYFGLVGVKGDNETWMLRRSG